MAIVQVHQEVDHSPHSGPVAVADSFVQLLRHEGQAFEGELKVDDIQKAHKRGIGTGLPRMVAHAGDQELQDVLPELGADLVSQQVREVLQLQLDGSAALVAQAPHQPVHGSHLDLRGPLPAAVVLLITTRICTFATT